MQEQATGGVQFLLKSASASPVRQGVAAALSQNGAAGFSQSLRQAASRFESATSSAAGKGMAATAVAAQPGRAAAADSGAGPSGAGVQRGLMKDGETKPSATVPGLASLDAALLSSAQALSDGEGLETEAGAGDSLASAAALRTLPSSADIGTATATSKVEVNASLPLAAGIVVEGEARSGATEGLADRSGLASVSTPLQRSAGFMAQGAGANLAATTAATASATATAGIGEARSSSTQATGQVRPDQLVPAARASASRGASAGVAGVALEARLSGTPQVAAAGAAVAASGTVLPTGAQAPGMPVLTGANPAPTAPAMVTSTAAGVAAGSGTTASVENSGTSQGAGGATTVSAGAAPVPLVASTTVPPGQPIPTGTTHGVMPGTPPPTTAVASRVSGKRGGSRHDSAAGPAGQRTDSGGPATRASAALPSEESPPISIKGQSTAQPAQVAAGFLKDGAEVAKSIQVGARLAAAVGMKPEASFQRAAADQALPAAAADDMAEATVAEELDQVAELRLREQRRESLLAESRLTGKLNDKPGTELTTGTGARDTGNGVVTTADALMTSARGQLISATGPLATGSAQASGSEGLPQSTSSAPFSVPLLGAQPQQALAENVRWMVNRNLGSAEINLTPAGMGPVSVKLDMDKDRLKLSIVAPHGVTRDALESLLPRLREQLQLQGHNQVDVNVSDRREAPADQRQQTGQQTNQQHSGPASGQAQGQNTQGQNTQGQNAQGNAENRGSSAERDRQSGHSGPVLAEEESTGTRQGVPSNRPGSGAHYDLYV